MNLQEELKALKERIAELEEQAKEEQEFPKNYDDYWFIDEEGSVGSTLYDNHYIDDYYIDRCHQTIGNIFSTKEQAEFAVEKLKVEAELRKFSRLFKEDENNWFILWHTYKKEVQIDWSTRLFRQGTIYFESGKKVEEAIEAVGKERIKKYIFGEED